MSESSGRPGRHRDGSEPSEKIIQQRRAEGQDGHVAGEPDPAYTDNPTFAAQTGTATDVAGAELDYVEEPGVGGVSGDPARRASDDAGGA